MRHIDISDVKAIELEILDYIDAICRKNGIKYYLAYGTLIGAIRHKGFIPWDDDIDICMKREDYDKFISVFGSGFDGRFKLLHPTIEKDYYYEFAKVTDVRTKVIGSGLKEIPDEGVWVDIFPLDRIAGCRHIQRILIQICMVFRILSVYEEFPRSKHSVFFYPIWLLSRLIGFGIPLKITNWLSRSGKGNKYIGYAASMSTSGAEYCYPVEWFEDSVSVEFEGMNYPAPKYYHDYLISQYGDYMTLPPEEKRIPHPVMAVWR